MGTPIPRAQGRRSLPKGDMFQVTALFAPQMETGVRHAADGNVLPRLIINRFVCRYSGVDAFIVDLHEAVATNPYFEFYLRAIETGRLEFIWQEDGGKVYSLAHELVVS